MLLCAPAGAAAAGAATGVDLLLLFVGVSDSGREAGVSGDSGACVCVAGCGCDGFVSGACAELVTAATLDACLFVALDVAAAAVLLWLVLKWLLLLLILVHGSFTAVGCSGEDVLMVTPILPDSLDNTSALRLVPTAGCSSRADDEVDGDEVEAAYVSATDAVDAEALVTTLLDAWEDEAVPAPFTDFEPDAPTCDADTVVADVLGGGGVLVMLSG